MTTLLEGKVAVVTGGAGPRGIGFATARHFAAQGASVVIVDLERANPAAMAAELGDGHLGVVGDVTRAEDCARVAETTRERFGRIDILVNNAGITQKRTLAEISGTDYDAVLDVNLRGTLLMSQAVVPVMQAQRSGSIVCISSVSAQRGGGIVGGPHYSAAKAGILGLTRAMARELGASGIRVNAITPGLIDTDILVGKLSDALRAELKAGVPLGRLGHPDDIGKAALFLASDLASYVTGATLDVNGGMLIH
ncbi:SDR family NAD(P)-dependent oxidoreductase [Marinivivus vitaminiproducens]|uniref:SDR family NAD(P)-dependent oxidoreductase n=1 Tax=Marinivivus vitaminiproducens TaxID=3035935 RepID=UPI0027A4C662|nr:SDR family oxidoreductase [Geminicoccaceae bacterium SCSIO 64248]